MHRRQVYILNCIQEVDWTLVFMGLGLGIVLQVACCKFFWGGEGGIRCFTNTRIPIDTCTPYLQLILLHDTGTTVLGQLHFAESDYRVHESEGRVNVTLELSSPVDGVDFTVRVTPLTYKQFQELHGSLPLIVTESGIDPAERKLVSIVMARVVVHRIN